MMAQRQNLYTGVRSDEHCLSSYSAFVSGCKCTLDTAGDSYDRHNHDQTTEPSYNSCSKEMEMDNEHTKTIYKKRMKFSRMSIARPNIDSFLFNGNLIAI